jgi:hypothetical protein
VTDLKISHKYSGVKINTHGGCSMQSQKRDYTEDRLLRFSYDFGVTVIRIRKPVRL